MIKQIFVEKNIQDLAYTQQILNHYSHIQPKVIDRYDDIWGRVKKPYLQKRDNLSLFLAQKKGQLVKLAPDAYGKGDEPHYYFIHAYNCIYECQYCYLQGYFNTPDLVLFVNHEEIIAQMDSKMQSHPKAWFHAGEFSDSLALNHITNEWKLYWDLFKKYPQHYLELRTKANTIKYLKELGPLPNVIVSYTLSPNDAAVEYDLKVPKLKSRLLAIQQLAELGFQIGIHFDPIINHENVVENYRELINELKNILPTKQWAYTSLGVVRFTKDVYRQVKNNYPDSKLHAYPYVKSHDDKLKYHYPLKTKILRQIKEELENYLESEKIYLCME
jgi:spore photoproduct lyase